MLAILNLLSYLNFQQFGSLTALTSLKAVQTAVSQVNYNDLVTVVDVLKNTGIIGSPTGGAPLLTDTFAFVALIESLVPLVSNLRASVAYIILEQLGVTGLQNLNFI